MWCLLNEKTAEKNRGFNVAHRIVRPVMCEPIGWRKLIQFEYLLAIVVGRKCKRVRGIETTRLNNTHDIGTTIADAVGVNAG